MSIFEMALYKCPTTITIVLFYQWQLNEPPITSQNSEFNRIKALMADTDEHHLNPIQDFVH